ncbi:hypothetical protein NLG97_g678 [Lecanicillium saksenae]|uniref:Uncharacterized protein n=1 Tax=Lecanicillium saksenae TaxID=468837 RepID=A0ACC1R5V3_9HYPO|nr:hypothetical protein NLG97_g678 [Lecanicillium saksenae]
MANTGTVTLGKIDLTDYEVNEHETIELFREVVPPEARQKLLEWREDDMLRLERARERQDDLRSESDRIREQVSRLQKQKSQLSAIYSSEDDPEGSTLTDISAECDQAIRAAFYLTVAHGGLSLDMIKQYHPEIRKLVENYVASKGLDVSASQFVPRGQHADVQERLEQAQREIARLGTDARAKAADVTRLESQLQQASLHADRQKSEIDTIKDKYGKMKSYAESCRLSRKQLETSYKSKVDESAKALNDQAHLLADEQSKSESLGSLLDIFSNESSYERESWDTVFDAGTPLSALVAVPSQAGILSLWREPWAMETTHRFDVFNVHQLCYEVIVYILQGRAPDKQFSKLLAKTASGLYQASRLSQELCDKLARTITALDFEDQGVPFDVALGLCQILHKIGERFPTVVSTRSRREVLRSVSQYTEEDEALLLKSLTCGWRGNLWDSIAICTKAKLSGGPAITIADDGAVATTVAVAVVRSINALLIVDEDYLRWVGCEAVVSVRPSAGLIQYDGQNLAVEVCGKVKVVVGLHTFLLQRNALSATPLPSVE